MNIILNETEEAALAAAKEILGGMLAPLDKDGRNALLKTLLELMD